MHTKDKLPKSFVFNKKRYKLRWQRPPGRKPLGRDKKPIIVDGQCSDPDVPASERVIYVNHNDSPLVVVDTAIHEALHAEMWWLTEEYVTRIANDLTSLLQRMGVFASDCS